MKKPSLIIAALLLSLTTSQGFGQGHSGMRTNRGAQLRGDSRSDKVHQFNETKSKKKNGHKDKNRGLGKEKGENKKH